MLFRHDDSFFHKDAQNSYIERQIKTNPPKQDCGKLPEDPLSIEVIRRRWWPRITSALSRREEK